MLGMGFEIAHSILAMFRGYFDLPKIIKAKRLLVCHVKTHNLVL